MKIIVKTIKKAYQHWEPNPLIRCYHYAGAFDGNKMICFAENNPIKTNNKTHRMGQKHNISKYIQYSFPHAESMIISKLLGRYDYIDPSWKFVIMRINRLGKILGSKPCESCQTILDALKIKNIYYSDDDGNFVCPSRTIKVEPFIWR